MKRKIYIIAVVCFILDVISKVLVTSFLHDEFVIIPEFFSLLYTKNTGGAFSIFSGGALVLAFVGIGAILLINKYMISDVSSKYEVVSYGFLLGGILGNLFERILFRSVTDFFNFNILGYNFPIFNVADIFICIGGFLLVINVVRGEFDEYQSRRRKD